MKFPLKIGRLAVGGVLLGTALGTAALSLGRSRGAPLIGQPLNVTIAAQLDAQDDAGSLCVEADVFYSDTQVQRSKVQTALEGALSGREAFVRVRSTQLIDEPVVTIYLRAGCNQKTTRRYVLLADVPTDGAAGPGSEMLPVAGGTSIPVATPAAGVSPGSASSARGATAASPVAEPPRAAASAPAIAPRKRNRGTAAAAPVAGAVEPRASSPASVPSIIKLKKPAVAPTQARSRLKLDPLELMVEREPTLRASSEMLTSPTGDEQQRAAAAALWRALNAQPQDVLRDAERLKTLEQNVKALGEQTARNQAALGQLSVELAQARRERYANWLVYALGILLLLAIGAAGYLWSRARSSNRARSAWWRGGDADDLEEFESPLPAAPPLAKAQAKPLSKAKPDPDPDLDVDLEVDEALFEDLKFHAEPNDGPAAALSRHDRQDFSSSLPSVQRAVNAEELFDIQQQADFFVSLGQYEQAIEVLKNHISDNVETSALAYLDLFKIYHTLKRRDEYASLRDDFNRVFNAEVPVFDAFSDQSNGLESYKAALSRIEVLWPSPKVLDVIEESIFRKPGHEGEAFDLEAYRELLLLYAIAKDVVDRRSELMDFEISGPKDSGRSNSAHPTFSATAIQPLGGEPPARAGEKTEVLEALPEITLPRASSRLGLDIDLSELPPTQPFTESLPSIGEPAPTVAPATASAVEPNHVATNPGMAPAPAADSHLLDFDLFDSATESQIAKKSTRS